MENKSLYPIKAVSKITGISLHVLRAWEKRYHAVVPTRTETNRRLYTQEDLQKLKLLKELTDGKYNIGSVAKLSLDELIDLAKDEHPAVVEKNGIRENSSIENADFYYNACLEVVHNFNSKELESILTLASIKLDQVTLLNKVILPLLNQIGQSWEQGEIRIYQEHMVSTEIKSFLLNLLYSYKKINFAPNMITTTPPGQYHEIGAIAAGLYAAAEGWNVTYLGSNLPAEEIIAAGKRLNSKVIALSILCPKDDSNLKRELLKFSQLIPSNTKLIVGGQAADSYRDVLTKIGAVTINDFGKFQEELRKVKTEMNGYLG
jgi:DNA-binding transcriptional MerR regulator/methylmalonyl-CoA mutase cobalamin-binding subunit